jgi:hypothetical protein
MNPPSLPPPLPGEKKSYAVGMALASLILTAIGFVLNVVLDKKTGASLASTGKVIGAGVALLMVVTGIALAAVALVRMRREQRAKVIGLSFFSLGISAVLIVGVFMEFAKGVKRGMQEAAEKRRITQEIQTSSRELQQEARSSFDPVHGITNVDTSKFDKLNRQMKEASRTLTGEDAIIAQVMSKHLDRIQAQLKAYEAAVKPFLAAGIFDTQKLTDKSQIEEKRQIVRTFLKQNGDLREAVMEAEKSIRADFAKTSVSAQNIEATMEGYHRKAAPQTALTVKIRDCDDKLGNAALGVLDLLENSWGKWKFDAERNKVRFENALDLEAYNGFVREVHQVSQEQLALQKRLVNQQN